MSAQSVTTRSLLTDPAVLLLIKLFTSIVSPVVLVVSLRSLRHINWPPENYDTFSYETGWDDVLCGWREAVLREGLCSKAWVNQTEIQIVSKNYFSSRKLWTNVQFAANQLWIGWVFYIFSSLPFELNCSYGSYGISAITKFVPLKSAVVVVVVAELLGPLLSLEFWEIQKWFYIGQFLLVLTPLWFVSVCHRSFVPAVSLITRSVSFVPSAKSVWTGCRSPLTPPTLSSVSTVSTSESVL